MLVPLHVSLAHTTTHTPTQLPPPTRTTSQEKFSKLVGRKEEKKEPSLYDDLSDSCTLTKKQRIYGFCICCGIGAMLSFLVRPCI